MADLHKCEAAEVSIGQVEAALGFGPRESLAAQPPHLQQQLQGCPAAAHLPRRGQPRPQLRRTRLQVPCSTPNTPVTFIFPSPSLDATSAFSSPSSGTVKGHVSTELYSSQLHLSHPLPIRAKSAAPSTCFCQQQSNLLAEAAQGNSGDCLRHAGRQCTL